MMLSSLLQLHHDIMLNRRQAAVLQKGEATAIRTAAVDEEEGFLSAIPGETVFVCLHLEYDGPRP
jgi:hypothetical protein